MTTKLTTQQRVHLAAISLGGLGQLDEPSQARPELPSAGAALAFLTGEPGGASRVFWTMLGRAAIVTPALFLTGEHRPLQLAGKALAVAGSIEIFVLSLLYWKLKHPETTEQTGVTQ